MTSFPVFQFFFPECIAERAGRTHLAFFARWFPGGGVLWFVGSPPRWNRFIKSKKAFYFSKHFFGVRHQGRGCRFKRRLLTGSFCRILAGGGNRAENESQKNCSCQISHSFILLDKYPIQTMTEQYTLKKRNVIFVHRRDCQKPASGKSRNVFDEGKQRFMA